VTGGFYLRPWQTADYEEFPAVGIPPQQRGDGVFSTLQIALSDVRSGLLYAGVVVDDILAPRSADEKEQ
jgi:hypothetical protein